MHSTRVNTKWLLKMVVFLVVLTVLGAWGLLDAVVFYPARGEASAQWALYEYLQSANDSNDLLRTRVDDPRAELAQLQSQRDELARQSEGESLSARRAQTKLKRLEWLEALSAVGALDPTRTALDAPREDLDRLDAALAGDTPPKPLAAWDIPLQWGFVVVGFGGALWLIWLMLRVTRTRYTYDAEAKALFLPDGRAVTPEDLVELDKRKWDKFIVTLRLKDGGAVRLDLLRYTPLEDWVVEMERAAGLADESADSASPEPGPEPVAADADGRSAG